MLRKVPIYLSILTLFSLTHLTAEEAPIGMRSTSSTSAKSAKKASPTKSFTGRIIGKNVRLRADADVDSPIIRELLKDELIVVVGEKNDFYQIKPTKEIKAYIFRSFILDNIVEGTRVNVRLAPNREALVIGHMNTGDRIDGSICEKNQKWLEIDPPSSTTFYIAKEFVEYAGGPELKAIRDKRQETVCQLVSTTDLLCQSELRKPFGEIDVDRIIKNYEIVINDYSDFPNISHEAKKKLSDFQEYYLQKKIAHLEQTAEQMSKNLSSRKNLGTRENVRTSHEISLSPSDRMKIWEPIEEGLYLSWTSMHLQKTMDDFYEDQKLKSMALSGILESYTDPVKNKPGDYIVKENGIPVAYVYSTFVNLHEHLGQRVQLTVHARPNNNFAFPAYFVLKAE